MHQMTEVGQSIVTRESVVLKDAWVRIERMDANWGAWARTAPHGRARRRMDMRTVVQSSSSS